MALNIFGFFTFFSIKHCFNDKHVRDNGIPKGKLQTKPYHAKLRVNLHLQQATTAVWK